jgi:uncharacterized protein (TIGR02099 family)
MRSTLATALRRLLRTIEVLAWAAFFAFAVIFLALRYWLLPNIESYRGEIVSVLSRSIGLPVKVGTLATDWQGLRPRISITDVRVYDRDGREALVLPAVENVVGWRSLAALQLRLHSFVIDGPRLSVRRDPRGEIFVAGIHIPAGKGEGRLTDWLLGQSEVVVRGAEVEWHDESRKAPPLRLSAVNFRLQNDGERHAIGLSARPPRQLGPGIELRALLTGASVRELGEWNGKLYAEFGYTDLAGWRAWLDYPLDLRRGEGALRLWATLAGGRLSQATADVALSNVVARLGKTLPVLELSSVRGRVYGRETPAGYDFGVRSLALSRPGAPAMNSTSFRATWEPASATSPAQRGSVTANLVELGPLVHMAEYLPLPEDLRKLLSELSPQGNLLDTRLEWTGQLPDQAKYTARTRFAGLGMQPWRSLPGFSGLSGTLDANESKGTVNLASRNAEIDLPRVFPDPRIAFETLGGEIAWERGAGAAAADPAASASTGAERPLSVRLAGLSFSNEDLAGTGSGTYAWNGEGPGAVDFTAQLTRVDGRNTARYLPLETIMGSRTRAWVASAVLAGQASDVKFRLKGDLRDFPFVDPAKGIFQVSAKATQATLDYANGWPRIEAIDADLLFEREKIQVLGRSASILGTRLSGVRVVLPSLLLADKPQLLIEGGAEGPTAEFLAFIQQSPVKRMIAGLSDGMSANGRGRLRLKLELPLEDLSRSKVAGEYQFTGNNVTLDQRLPQVERATGRIGFTEAAFTVHDVRGQLFGGDVRISGGTRPEGGIAIAAEGRATVEGIRPVFDHPLRRRLSGGSRYTAQVTVKDGRTHLTFDSGLDGVASALPAPMLKNAADVLPLRVEVFPGDGRERVSLQLGPPGGRVVTAEFLRAGKGEVQRSIITFNPIPGETPRIPERRGTTLRGAVPALDLDRWLPLLTDSAGAATAATAAAGAQDGASFDLKVGVLDALGKRMRAVNMTGIAEAGGWSASMNTSEFAGDLSYRSEEGGRLMARFSRFTLPEDSPGVKPGEGARDLPAVDIVAESFVHRERKLGRVEIQARHQGKDWRIDKLSLVNPDAALTGTGLWKPGDTSRTSLKFKLEVSNVGNLLDRVGYPDHVKSARGKLEGTLDWNGDPVSMDYATLNGSLQMQAEDGQFLEIEPGIGKLVSLMSLQMLPRRISLDFRDVFSKGFQFDRIASSMAIERGVMAVKQFNMRGPAAEVGMTGQVDLSLETQALDVRVIPQLGDTASTVVSLINPVAGVATLIAGRVLKNPLGKMLAYEYKISGTWADPKVERLQQTAVPASAPQPGEISR